jgi:hypothetical protein
MIIERRISMKKALLIFALVISIAGLLLSLEIDEASELLMAERGGDIEFLSRINLGIPDGENWIAIRPGLVAHIYTINTTKEIRFVDGINKPRTSELRFWDRQTRYMVYLDNLGYDIMQGIPGTPLGSMAAKFGDFNGDARDEIIFIMPSPVELDKFEFYMWAYDSANGKMVFPFATLFVLHPSLYLPPIIFTNYHGTNGFAVYTRIYWRQGFGETEDYEEHGWIFFAWDMESQRYIEIAELNEADIDFSAISGFVLGNRQQNNITAYQPEVGIIEETAPITTAEQPLSISQSDTRTNLLPMWVFITGGVVIVGMIVLFVVRRKR